MKTFVTLSGGILLALSCAATSDARLHANRGIQSEPSNYNPDQDSQTRTRRLDNSCLDCGDTTGLAQTLPSYESKWLNWFPITPLQAQAASPSDPTLARDGIQLPPHQAAVLGGPIQAARKPLPSYESKGFQITPLELVIFGPNDVKEHTLVAEGGLGG